MRSLSMDGRSRCRGDEEVRRGPKRHQQAVHLRLHGEGDHQRAVDQVVELPQIRGAP